MLVQNPNFDIKPELLSTMLSRAKMISRARTLVPPLTPHHKPRLWFCTQPNTDRDTAILARFQQKDWLTPKQATTLCNSLNHPSSAVTLLHLYTARKDFNPTEPFCTSLITKLAHANLLDPIHTLLHQTLKRRSFSDDFFFTLIKLYAHVARRIDKAVETLLSMPDFQCWPSRRTFNFVLNVLVANRLYDVAGEVYEAAPRLAVEVDACCMNILIKGLCQQGELSAAVKVFDEFPKSGLEPNVRTFSTLMHGLCEKGMVEEAFEWLEKMEKCGVCPDVVVFNVLIGGLKKKGRGEEGKEVLDMMVRKGFYPNVGSYQQVLYGLLDAKRFIEALEVVEGMVSRGFVPSFVSFKQLVVGLCRHRRTEEVDWALRQMVRQGFVPRMGMWRHIVNCAVSKPRNYESTCVSLDEILEGCNHLT
ncbi:pentatricopeptide repeat-containing protein At3g14580, mitochondrial-like [Lotus japonicus]|uniref:pentatricopeptide repeat-containing protein At3g14580, mitochondrial-like n=1 Tax=Lotus japonicus TaxID=34305 RepID=UPI002589C0F1|nr:pentatricopeptide repeat-containing protein At3g14580, mitochondrial-like [Lotus japonicus]